MFWRQISFNTSVLTKHNNTLPWMGPWILDVDASGISTKPDITIKPEAFKSNVPGNMNKAVSLE
jgi:hypothetical protein